MLTTVQIRSLKPAQRPENQAFHLRRATYRSADGLLFAIQGDAIS